MPGRRVGEHRPPVAAARNDVVGHAALRPPARITPAGGRAAPARSAAGAGAVRRARRWPLVRGGSGAGRPTSGSRNGRLRCTGPVRGGLARAPGERAATSPPRGVGDARIVEPAHATGRRGGSGRSSAARRRRAAPAAGRRSRRASGPSDRSASTTAGWKLAAAVPLVHSSTAGLAGEPEAEGDEGGRPLVVDDVDGDVRPRSARASAIGVLREPGRDDGVRPPAPDPLVDERGAERRLAWPSAAHARPGRYGALAVWWASCSSRSGPTSCARGATSASAASSGPRRSPTTRTSTASRGRLSAVPARPDGAAGDGDAGRRGLRPQVRRPGARPGDHRERHPDRRREGLEFHLERAQRANTRDAHRLLWLANDPAPAGAQGAEGAPARGLLHDGSTSATPTSWSRGGRGRARRRRGAAVPRQRRRHAEVDGALGFAAEAGITAVPTYVIDGRWSIPGAQDPDAFVQVLQGAGTERAADAPALSSSCEAGERLVLVHGFTQTGRSWDADRRASCCARTVVVPSTAPGHGGSPPSGADLAAAPAARRHGRTGDVHRLLDGRPRCLHLALARPDLVERLVLVSATAGIDDDGERAPAGRRRRAGGDDRARRRRRLPRPLARPAAVRARRRRPPAPTIAAATRRGAGVEPPPRRHRHPGAAVGPARRSCRCRCSSSPARSTPSSSRSPSGWRSAAHATLVVDRRRWPHRPPRAPPPPSLTCSTLARGSTTRPHDWARPASGRRGRSAPGASRARRASR